jgi:peptidoglycan/LPS O-acetylase OafA/YrhL
MSAPAARNAPLDILRLVAIVLVMGRHLAVGPPITQLPLFLFVAHWQWGGWVGVDLFFVLSGYLIANLLFREHQKYGQINFQRFLIRRWFKIYPAFWGFMIITVIVAMIYGNPLNVPMFLKEFFLIHNYSKGLWDHTWSLAIEEHFYLGLAALLAVLSDRCRHQPEKAFRLIPIIFLMVAIGCLSCRVYLTATIFPYNAYVHLFPTHLRLDALMFGVLLAWLWNYHQLARWVKRRSVRWALVSIGVVALVPAFMFEITVSPWVRTYGLTLFYLAAGAILIGCLSSSLLARPVLKPLARLGTYSYAVYLWHIPVSLWGLEWLDRLLGDRTNWWVYMVFYFGTSFGLGWLTTKLVEGPMLQLRDRIFPSRLHSTLLISHGDQENAPTIGD